MIDLQKILQLIKDKGVTAYEISKQTSLSEVGINKILSGKTKKPNKTTLKELESYVNEHILLGNSYVSDVTLEYKSEGKIVDDNKYKNKDVYIIPIKGRGGLHNFYYADELFNELKKEKLQVDPSISNNSRYFKIEVEGDSMDDGSKKSLAIGDWVYCRSIAKTYWKSKLHNHKWSVFCFFHNERGIIFKQIISQDVERGILVLGSLNPNKKEYPNFEISLAECTYVCNVIKVVTNF